MKIAYVVKRYPRFSETFIVNEILAHERAGSNIEIFSLRPCNDTHFQDRIALVKAPLTQIDSGRPKSNIFWESLQTAAVEFPNLWEVLAEERHADVVSIQQSLVLALAVRRREIDHLHAHFATLPATVARLAAKLAGIPYTLTAHAKDIFHDSVAHHELSQKLRDASAVITVSQFNVDYLQTTFGLEEERIFRVYNGLDLGEFTYDTPRERTRTILGVGRLVEKKGFDDLIRACAILRDRSVAFDCLLVGGGAAESSLLEMIDTLRLHEHVTLTGPIPQQQLQTIMKGASVFAAPCVLASDGDRDGLPTVLLEAMAMGTPCVSTPITGIPEIIKDQQTGLIVDERAPSQLAAAIESLLDDRELRCRIARAARNVIEREFDCQVTSRTIRQIFSEGAERAQPSMALLGNC